jgi:beta-glucosidase
VLNVLNFVGRAASRKQPAVPFDREADLAEAVSAAKQCAVLLKNDRGVLPLRKDSKVVFIGEFARAPRYQGSGSSHINSARVTDALSSAKGLDVSFAQGCLADGSTNDSLIAQAVAAARGADAAVLFVGLPDEYETEGADRTSLELPEGQNKLIAAVAAAQPNTAAVLHNGAPVTMPWIDSVPAVLEMYLAGDGCGEAEVSLLFGAESPSGKLAETFPLRLCDTPAYLTFPGEGRRVEYREGVFTGYRYYDKKEMNVLFPFGHGLSYTSFGYGEPRVSAQEITDAQKLEVSLEITNTGACAGSEAVQLYVRSACECPVKRPVRELRGVCKLALEPGASGRAVFTLAGRDFAYFDTRLGDFAVAGGDYYIDIGSSSRDIRSSVKVRVTPAETIPETFDRSSTVGEALRAPRGREILAGAVAAMGPAEGTEELGAATKIMMQHMFDEMPLIALVHFGGLGYEEVDAIIAKLNARQ